MDGWKSGVPLDISHVPQGLCVPQVENRWSKLNKKFFIELVVNTFLLIAAEEIYIFSSHRTFSLHFLIFITLLGKKSSSQSNKTLYNR